MKTKETKKKEYVMPTCIPYTAYETKTGIMAVSVHETLPDEDDDFHNGAKEFNFDNDFWVLDMDKDDVADVTGECKDFNFLIK